MGSDGQRVRERQPRNARAGMGLATMFAHADPGASAPSFFGRGGGRIEGRKWKKMPEQGEV